MVNIKSKLLVLVASASLFIVGCQHPVAHTGKPQPHASTAAVGNNLTNLGNSINSAQQNVKDVRGNLSEVDAKAVRIQESIRNW